VITSLRTQAGDRLARRWLLAPLFALLVLATACGGAGGPTNGGGGGGGGGGGDAGSGTPGDLAGLNGATAIVGGVRVTATDNVTSVLVYEPTSKGFIFTASNDNADGTDVTDVWQIIGELVDGPQACGDDVLIALRRQQLNQMFIATSCTIEVDDFEPASVAPGEIQGRFAGTLLNPLSGVSVAVTNGVFVYAEPAP
jgi:hypothetical protein